MNHIACEIIDGKLIISQAAGLTIIQLLQELLVKFTTLLQDVPVISELTSSHDGTYLGFHVHS